MSIRNMPQAVRTFLTFMIALAVLAVIFALTSTPEAKAAPVQTGIVKETPPREGAGGDWSSCGAQIPFSAAKGGITPKNPCADDGVTKKEATTYKLTYRCGGSAGAGSLRGGGWYGAGIAGASCIWGHLWS